MTSADHANTMSRLRCWLFGHDWRKAHWDQSGVCARCGARQWP